ncbi:MAG: murein biosynthesis integral membrane protein MurJ [Anaerolineaceae bacterium]|nr:murein biosynthesis integral membrane protein MurJ [Anaerolineaceae bacterium]
MANPSVDADRNSKLARSTLVVMIAFGIAKAISLVQTVVIAQVFGLSQEWDAFVVANSIPELIFTLIAGGALAHAFIPIFSGFLARSDLEGAWRTATHVINTIFLATLTVSIIAFIAAPWLVANVAAPGFDVASQAQTVELMRILLLTTLIFSVSGISMGILQSHNHFLLPALAPIMFDVGILIGVIFLIGPFGVNGIALGAVLGAAMHFGIQVPGLIRFRARWWPKAGFRDPTLWRIIRLMLPRIAGLGVFSINFIVMNNIASRMGAGSVSALNWGWRLMQIPQTLIGTAMGTVIFPTLAALSELDDRDGKRDAMSGALRFIMIASIPSAIGLIFVGQPLIKLLERGAFDASASALVYSTLQFFALGLVVHSALEVVARSFYADKDTLTPLWAALGGATINLIGSFVLSDFQAAESAGFYNLIAAQYPFLSLQPVTGNVGGLALANSLGVAFEVTSLLWILRRRWQGINEDMLTRTTLKTLAASLAMIPAFLIVNMAWDRLGLANRGIIFDVALVTLEAAAGLAVFLIVAILLKMHELRTMVDLILRRQKATPEVIAS